MKFSEQKIEVAAEEYDIQGVFREEEEKGAQVQQQQQQEKYSKIERNEESVQYSAVGSNYDSLLKKYSEIKSTKQQDDYSYKPKFSPKRETL